jgi:hypothetical protein
LLKPFGVCSSVERSRLVNDTPKTWHYGLVARWWAEFNTDGPEIGYFKGLIQRFGEPAVDVACGWPAYIPLYGLDVDGCDVHLACLLL